MNDINYYLGKGYDLEFAKYFANGKRKIVSVAALVHKLCHLKLYLLLKSRNINLKLFGFRKKGMNKEWKMS